MPANSRWDFNSGFKGLIVNKWRGNCGSYSEVVGVDTVLSGWLFFCLFVAVGMCMCITAACILF